jgi:hypothetical protein
MSYHKNSLKLKVAVFLIITSLVFWLIPSNLIFGEGEDQGGGEGTVIEESSGDSGGEESDTIAPVITLNGDNPVTVVVGSEYTDASATASDDIDGDITGSIVVNNPVDTSAVGTYSVTYNVSDNAGNAATEVVRTVNVVDSTQNPDEITDTTPPVITLIGDNLVTVEVGSTYVDAGATATDNKDASVTVTTTGTVNTNFASSYTISYNASDAAGNAAATVTRTVNVTSVATIDTDKPDYLPTDYVLVTGSGWLPGETVKLDFHETLIDLFQQTFTYDVVADSEGNIRDIQYLIELRHLGASFVLTATGLTSGLTAQTTFTDAKSANLTSIVLSGSPTGFTFAPGTYTYNGVTVANGVASITVTPTGAGTITVDGTTVSSGTASDPIALTAEVEQTITVVATEPSKDPKTYTIKVTRLGTQATPTFTPSAGAVAFGTPVTITSSGATSIYYTMDGTDPATSAGGSTYLYNPAAKPIINAAITLKALAVKSGWGNSDIGSATYTQAASADLTNIVLSEPTTGFTFASGTYTYNGVTVANSVASIKVKPTGAGTITVDGATVISGHDSVSITLTAGVEQTITVVVTETGKSPKIYTIKVTRILGTQATPTFTPSAGAVAFGTPVTITSAGADHIYYTTNGDTPTTSSTEYAGSVNINAAITLKALAVKSGWGNSAIGSATYAIACSVTYNGNGNTGGTAPVDSKSPYVSGTEVTVLAAGSLVNEGEFAGWNTLASGLGTSYASGAKFDIAADTTLYAVWKIVKTYSDGTFTTEKTIFAQGETVYFKAKVLNPEKYYRFKLDPPTGATFYVTSPSWTNGVTELTGSYELKLPNNVATGNWRLHTRYAVDAGGSSEGHYVDCNFTVEAPKGSIVVTKSGMMGTDKVSIILKKGGTTVIETKTEVGDGTYTFSGLVFGNDYSITEVYKTGNTYTYAAATQNPANDINVPNATPVNVSLVNNPEKGSIELFKTDASTVLALGGSTFELYLYKWGSWNLIDTQVLGPNGHYKWDNLPYGLYKIVETIATPGYLLAPPVKVTVDGETPNVILTEEIADPRIPGAITLNKSGLDATAAAGFTLYDLVGNPIGTEKTVTGNGSITWSGLPWDTYKIVETTTPSGYTPIADITGIVVDSTHLSYSFDKVNTTITVLGSITLNKSGLDTTDTAGFTLYNSSGNAVGEEKTITGNGSVSWSSLLQDIYKIVETTVPAGYDKMDDITGIVVESGNLNHSFDRVNTKTPPATPPTKKTITKKTTTTTTTPGVIEVLGIQELPFTGMNPAIPISGISSIFAGGLMVMLSSIRRKFRRK